MSQVYVVTQDGSTQPMARIRCKNEDIELQRLLEKNPNLIPGDQVNPESPRRWMIVKREMPVPSPATGSDRWSIDFFFVDQSAIPTFIECKRYADTRARREVVGQMFEYAANGHYYWDKESIRGYAESTAQALGTTIEDALADLQPDDDLGVDEFFTRVQENLREAQIRIVFFLEEAPAELKSVVDFLNKQMERSEILLVEARQYALNGTTVVSPTLFGFTEEARQVKRHVSVTSVSPQRMKWDEESFFADVEKRLEKSDVAAVRNLFESLAANGYEIVWGTGVTVGTFGIKWPPVFTRSIISVTSGGAIGFNFGWMKGSDEAVRLREFLAEHVVSLLGLKLPENYAARQYTEFRHLEWAKILPDMISIFDSLKKQLAAI